MDEQTLYAEALQRAAETLGTWIGPAPLHIFVDRSFHVFQDTFDSL